MVVGMGELEGVCGLFWGGYQAEAVAAARRAGRTALDSILGYQETM